MDPPPQPWVIVVRTVDGKSVRISLRAKDDDASVFPQLNAPRSVSALRSRVAEELSKPGVYPSGELVEASRIKILWRGRMLKDESPLTDYMGLVEGLNSDEPPILHVVLQMYQTANGSTTPSKDLVAKQKAAPKHSCQLKQIKRHAVVCDVCALPGLSQSWCCQSCNYDECNGCYDARKELYDDSSSSDSPESDSDSDLPPPLIPLQPTQAVPRAAASVAPAVPQTAAAARLQPSTTTTPSLTIQSTLNGDEMRRWSSIGAPSPGSARGSTPSTSAEPEPDVTSHSSTPGGATSRASANVTSIPQSRRLPHVPAFNVLNFLGIRNNTQPPPAATIPLATMNALVIQANAIQEATRQLGTLHAQEHIYVNQIQASAANSEQVSASVHEGHHAIQQAMAHQREVLNQISLQIVSIASSMSSVTGGVTVHQPQIAQPQSFAQMMQSLMNPHPTQQSLMNPSTQVQIHFGPGGAQIVPQQQSSASFSGMHCIHCRGLNGPCACAFRCPRQEGTTQCIAFGAGSSGSSAGTASGAAPSTASQGFSPSPFSGMMMPPGLAGFLPPGLFGMLGGPAFGISGQAVGASSSAPSTSAPAAPSTSAPAAPSTSASSAPPAAPTVPSIASLSSVALPSSLSDSDGRLVRAERMIEHLTGIVANLTGSITGMQTVISSDQSRIQALESQVANLHASPGSVRPGASEGGGGSTHSTSDSTAPALRPRGNYVTLSDPVGLAISGYSSPGLLQLAILYRALVGGDRDFDSSSESIEMNSSSGFSALNATAIKDRIRALNAEERAGFDRILKSTSSRRQAATVASAAASAATATTTTATFSSAASSTATPPVVLRSGFLSARGGLSRRGGLGGS